MFNNQRSAIRFFLIISGLLFLMGFTTLEDQISTTTTFVVAGDAFGKIEPQENQNTVEFEYLKVSNDPIREAYLQFDIQGLDDPVSQATLRIYAQNSGVGHIDLWKMPSTWTDSTITFANAPHVEQYITSISSFSEGWIELDVTTAVNNNGLVSFKLISSSGEDLLLDSLETIDGHPAELLIQTTPILETTAVTPEADAFTKSSRPEQNTDEFEYLKIEQDPQLDSYLKFNVADIEGEVVQATLRLFAQTGSVNGLTIASVDSNWAEFELTYENVPNEIATIHSTTPFDAGWLEIDVTSAFENDAAISFKLFPNGNEPIQFDSKETPAGHPPELVLTTAIHGQLPPPDPAPPPSSDLADFFVATDGHDSNPGTEAKPLRNIQTALDQALPGDIIMVRGGVYHEVIAFTTSGVLDHPITLINYPGELPIIDGDSVDDAHGEYELPPVPPSGFQTCNETVSPPTCFHYRPLVEIAASYIVFDGLEVRHSLGRGIWVHNGDYRIHDIIIRNSQIHNNRNAGMKAHSVDNFLFENNRVWNNSNYATHDRPAKVYNWSHAVNSLLSSNVTYRNNVVFENYGEGIGTGRGSSNVQVLDNLIYDNKIQVYIHRSVDVIVDGNLTYCTNRPAYNRGGQPGSAIALNNEYDFPHLSMNDNIQVTNNLIAGCRQGIGFWAGGGDIKTGSSNVVVAHNTIMNLMVNKEFLRNGEEQFTIGINILPGPHNNIEVSNNIVTGAEIMARVGAAATFTSNLWEKLPETSLAHHAQDIIGDPYLVNAVEPTAGGEVASSWFQLTASSPAINAATSSSLTFDFWDQSREDKPDIGAHEH